MPDQNNLLEKLPQEGGNFDVSENKNINETIKAPEQILEVKQKQNVLQEENAQSLQNQNSVVAQQAQIQKDAIENKIEDILEDGLQELYLQMPKEKQEEFKKKGEETTNKIMLLLKETKIKIGKILTLVIAWLSIIPGVNKFFIKQEAKIKTDQILKLKK